MHDTFDANCYVIQFFIVDILSQLLKQNHVLKVSTILDLTLHWMIPFFVIFWNACTVLWESFTEVPLRLVKATRNTKICLLTGPLQYNLLYCEEAAHMRSWVTELWGLGEV